MQNLSPTIDEKSLTAYRRLLAVAGTVYLLWWVAVRMILPNAFNPFDRPSGANIIPPDRGQSPQFLDYYTLDILKQDDVSSEVGSTMRDFVANWSADRRSSLIDILNDEKTGYQFRAFSGSIEMQKDQINFPVSAVPENGKPHGFSTVLPCLKDGKPQSGFFLQLASGSIYQLTPGDIKTPVKMSKTSCQFPADLEQVIPYQGLVVALDSSGQLIKIGKDGSRTSFLDPKFADRRFSHILNVKWIEELL